MATPLTGMNYHKITYNDCQSVATKDEKKTLGYITSMDLMLALAQRWCSNSGYRLGGYLGRWCWDATEEVLYEEDIRAR